MIETLVIQRQPGDVALFSPVMVFSGAGLAGAAPLLARRGEPELLDLFI
jgi:hypothetical protein